MKFEEPEFRFERKFRTTGFAPKHVEAMIKTHPAGFYEAFPMRRNNSMYFDSLDYDRFVQNVEGERDRTKARIRWYGEMRGLVEKSTLEFKIKRGLLGHKRRFPLPPFTIESPLSRRTFRDLVRSVDAPPDLMHELYSVDMVLLVSYVRRYFVSRNGRFRLTMDTDQHFCDIHRLTNTLLPATTYRSEVVLELKYDTDADSEANWVTNAFPLRVTKNSKYATGIDRVCLW